MANTTYPKGAQKILGAAINFATDTIKACLVSSSYTFSTAHEFVADLGTRIGTDQALAGKSVAGGVLDADDLDFGPLAPGSTVKAVVIYKDTGNPSTSPVLLYLDSGPNVGLPFTTNGGALTIPWNNDTKKIARLNLPVYPKGGEKMLSGAINFAADTIKAVALPASYAYDAEHEFLADVGTVVGTAPTLASKSIASGVFDAADASLGSPSSGDTVASVLLYKDTGDAATSPVLLHLTNITGLPVATSGAEISVRWSNGASKIFSLATVA